MKNPSRGSVDIGIVGKYVHLKIHTNPFTRHWFMGGFPAIVVSTWNTSTANSSKLKAPSSLSVIWTEFWFPGGFGDRGTEGKIAAIQYARTRNIPYFGFAWECSWLSWNSRATSQGLRQRTPLSLTKTRQRLSSICSRISEEYRPRERRCDSERTHAFSPRARSQPSPTARRRYPNGIDTDMRLRTNIANGSRRRA